MHRPQFRYDFSRGDNLNLNGGQLFSFVVMTATSGRITGLAVQYSGNWLFAARRGCCSVHAFLQTTGVLVQDIDFTSPNHSHR